jgi:hypothetical protein
MKIGLSLSRCVRDIVEGRVNINDVLILITRTDFDPTVQEQWDSIWIGYQSMNPEWYGLDHDAVYAVVMDLWNRGLVHQPRKFGANPVRRREFWLEAVLPDSELENNTAAKAAWDQFQVISGLANVGVDKQYQ